MPQLSVVVPIYNEAPNAEALVQELRETLDRLTFTAEVVLVDDGSTDETFALLSAACADDPRFCIVRLRRNFGQTAALAAGIDHASGAIIVTMDGDLQNDPADIPRLLAALDAGGGRRERLAPRPPGPVPLPAAAVDHRQRHHRRDDQRAHPRLRLRHQGVPRRDREIPQALWRDASLHRRHRGRSRRHGRPRFP